MSEENKYDYMIVRAKKYSKNISRQKVNKVQNK